MKSTGKAARDGCNELASSGLTPANVCMILYVQMLRLEWDKAKNETNKAKHGIDFETAQLVFDDPFCVTFVERFSDGEERWHAIGSIQNVIILVVVHTYSQKDSDEEIRIISARRATRGERKLYAQAISEET